MRSGLKPAGEEIRRLLAAARREGRQALTEPEALTVVRSLGFGVPEQRVVRDAAEARAADLAVFPGDRVVVKVVSAEILHKSDEGGVAMVAKKSAAIGEAVSAMERRFSGRNVRGYSLNEHVEHDAGLGGEVILGMRWSDEFGPVVSLGPGGLYAELLAKSLEGGRVTAILSPDRRDESLKALRRKALWTILTASLRGLPPRIEPERLEALVGSFLDFAATALPEDVLELEINPLALTQRGPVALDALLRLGSRATAPAPERPKTKLRKLFEPGSIAVVGVSARGLNPGRIIVRNILAAGFDSASLYIVKPGTDSLEGCACFPDVTALPVRVDLAVLAVEASRLPRLMEQIVEGQKAESVILIPGGLDEHEGSEGVAEVISAILRRSRDSGWRGPVVNGGNCLGVRSVPGGYDTLFIPRYKLRFPDGDPAPLALLSQSGAFAVARASKLESINPRYVVSIGNQIDLTMGDYLDYLADDLEVEVFACYLEGFRPLDGRRFLAAVSRITVSARVVVLYRAGRTARGAAAAASHTAAIAGDYAMTRELAEASGALVAESLDDFTDLTRLMLMLGGRKPTGPRLGALSNAGFESVAVADNLGNLELAALSGSTRNLLVELFERSRLQSIVTIANPLDVTPILDDELFAKAAGLLLSDSGVDVGIIGCVPLTGALHTLAESGEHSEHPEAPGSIARRLGALWRETSKPWVAVVDGGPLYDPLAGLLEAEGIPTFRSIDRALEKLRAYVAWHLGRDSINP